MIVFKGNRIWKALSVALLACVLYACATTDSSTPTSTTQVTASTASLGLTDEHLELIITDIVSAMIQINELSPFNTTVQYSDPKNTFGRKMIEALSTAGYGLQQVDQDQGSRYISYANGLIQNETGQIRQVEVNVGGISLSRAYKVEQGRVIPDGIMFVQGSQSFSNIVLNENIFLQQGGGLRFETGVELETLGAEVTTSALRRVTAREGAPGNTVSSPDSIIRARNNLFDQKNDVVDRSLYSPLRRVEIEFDDFTLNLGRANKTAIGQLIDDLKLATDIIAITSCAGNSGTIEQAEGRAKRIKEEFLLYNIPSNQVINTGCIVSEYLQRDVKPRTVIVSQQRKEQGDSIIAQTLPTEYPHRPIVMTIPYGSGGATDFQARIATMVAGNEEYLGQPIAIVNKPGSGGRTGWTWFSNTAANNGYDIASYNVPHFIAQSIKFETPYNIDTLEPVANWGADPAVLVVPRSSPYQTLREFVSAARQQPGRLTVSGAGLFVGHHIALLQMSKSAAINLDYQTAKGGAAALKQVINSEVDAGINNMSDAFRSRDKLRILAIADLERHRFVPDVPTFRELGVDVDNASVNYRGIMVPKGTPIPIIQKLEVEMLNMFDDPVVINRMEQGGSPMLVMNREKVLSMWNERQASLQQLLKGL